MSAREHLLWLARVGENTHGPSASDAIDAYAHELAEKQRRFDVDLEGFTDPQMAVYAVADLIDPEVES